MQLKWNLKKFKNATYAKKCIETLKQQKLDYNEYMIFKWSIEPIITIGNSINWILQKCFYIIYVIIKKLYYVSYIILDCEELHKIQQIVF